MLAPSSKTEQVLQDLLEDGNALVITGAGISTDSGIPDYRGPSGAAQRKHSPMTYQTFRTDPRGRHRYWARSHLGWPHMASAQPNAAHVAVAQWEQVGFLCGLITQNVDSLHTKAGHVNVVDLHGRLDTVMCMQCDRRVPRAQIHQELTKLNPTWNGVANLTNPDGDADLDEEFIDSFTMVHCSSCNGALKPDVVYFGENVPVERVEQCNALTDQCSSVIILGSTLSVYSARRFVMRAHKVGKPIAIVNQGETRFDEHAAIRLDAPLADVLPRITRNRVVRSTY